MPYLNRGGVKVHYQVRGDGVPLLMCNGWGPPIEWMTELYMPNFADRFRCATYDLRGMGRTDAPEDDAAYDMREIAQDGLAVMDELGWKTAHVWGASMGANQASIIAILAPERARSLCISGPDLGIPNMYQKKYAQVLRDRGTYAAHISKQKENAVESARRACEFYFTPELLARRSDIVDLVARITAETPARRIWPSFQKLIDMVESKVEPDLPDHAEPDEMGFPIWKYLRNIKAPTLILQGYGDQLIHRDCAQAAFEEIPNAELRMFKPFRHSFSGSPEIQRQQADWIWMHETSHLGLKGV